MDNDKLLNKKTDSYNTEWDNFIAPTEITVTITLNEYRKLVSNDATRKQAIDKANEDKYEREQKIKAVNEENARLKGENYDLKNQIDELKKQLDEKAGLFDA